MPFHWSTVGLIIAVRLAYNLLALCLLCPQAQSPEPLKLDYRALAAVPSTGSMHRVSVQSVLLLYCIPHTTDLLTCLLGLFFDLTLPGGPTTSQTSAMATMKGTFGGWGRWCIAWIAGGHVGHAVALWELCLLT